MLYEDKFGNLLIQDEVECLSPWEIEEKGIRKLDDYKEA